MIRAMAKSAGKTTTSGKTVKKAKRLFFVGLLDISWRLALSLILPIVGGARLDSKLDKDPIFTIIGLVVGFVLAGLVIRNTVIKLQKEIS